MHNKAYAELGAHLSVTLCAGAAYARGHSQLVGEFPALALGLG